MPDFVLRLVPIFSPADTIGVLVYLLAKRLEGKRVFFNMLLELLKVRFITCSCAFMSNETTTGTVQWRE